MTIADISFAGVNLFTACFYWFFTGAIAGTVAHFVVRGRLGCFFVNFFVGIIGAVVAYFILNLFLSKQTVSLSFIEITVAASVFATLIAFIFNQVRQAEGKYQRKLLDRER